MNNKTIFAGIALVWAVGCAATEYHRVFLNDPEQGTTTVGLEGNILGGSKAWHEVQFNVERTLTRDSMSVYHVVLRYTNRSVMLKDTSLRIDSTNESLTCILDGRRVRLRADSPSTKSVEDDFNVEVARYVVTRPFLEALARAAIVEIRVRGAANSAEKFFTPNNVDFLKQFLEATRE